MILAIRYPNAMKYEFIFIMVVLVKYDGPSVARALALRLLGLANIRPFRKANSETLVGSVYRNL